MPSQTCPTSVVSRQLRSLFYYPAAQTTLSAGLTGIFEEREGGDMDVLKHGPTESRTFFERNESIRITSQIRLDHSLGGAATAAINGAGLLTLKNSVSLFDRSIEIPGYTFDGRQLATYSEASLLLDRAAHDIVFGIDLRSDAFRENAAVADAARDYLYTSSGAFAQDTWDASGRVVVEAGLRADYHNTYGFFLLPKASLLYRATEDLSARVGGGLGYKAPTVFLEPSEERAFRGVLALGDEVVAETSRGGSIDVNYSTLLFDRLAISFNQAFYFTDLEHPLVPGPEDAVNSEVGMLRYESADGAIRTRALETNAKLSLGDFKLFLGYVYLDVLVEYNEVVEPLPLTPEHKTYTVLVYEKHGTGRIGLEAYFTGPQALPDRTRTAGYWITGVMAERRFGPARIFLNFENFLDTKQRNYAPVVLGPRTNPRFAEIWAPMDGFIINGGVKLTL